MAKASAFWLKPIRAILRAIDRIAKSASISNIVGLTWIVIWLAVCILVVEDLSRELVTIEPISVPKTFVDNGYTPEVASRRLQDALNNYVKNAGSSMQGLNIAPRDELPNFVVPKIELSLSSVVSTIRSVLHYSSGRRISGEFIIRGNLAWLRLRVDGQEAYRSSAGFDLENLDELLTAAASSLMEKIQPYLIASTLSNSDPKGGAEKADEIIGRLSASDPSIRLTESDVNVQWSYILKGAYLYDQKEYSEAEKILRKAIGLNPNNWAAHNNLGNALRGQHRFDQAIAEYRAAIRINPRIAMVHDNLGMTLRDKVTPRGNLDDVIAAHRRAIEIDRKFSSAHYNLGLNLADQGNFGEAISEFHLAITHAGKVNPSLNDKYDLVWAHFGLGNALFKQGNTEDAIAEYNRAIEVDPNFLPAKKNLRLALQKAKTSAEKD